MRVYIERNNMQLEWIRYRKICWLYSRLLLRTDGFNAISLTERISGSFEHKPLRHRFWQSRLTRAASECMVLYIWTRQANCNQSSAFIKWIRFTGFNVAVCCCHPSVRIWLYCVLVRHHWLAILVTRLTYMYYQWLGVIIGRNSFCGGHWQRSSHCHF